MPPYERHVFVCENVRPPENPRGCCSAKNSPEIRARLKEAVIKAGLRGRVRINKSGCLDQCENGVTVVVYPEAVWYGHVTLDDVDEIFQEHILNGRAVERLRLDHMRPDATGAPAPQSPAGDPTGASHPAPDPAAAANPDRKSEE